MVEIKKFVKNNDLFFLYKTWWIWSFPAIKTKAFDILFAFKKCTKLFELTSQLSVADDKIKNLSERADGEISSQRLHHVTARCDSASATRSAKTSSPRSKIKFAISTSTKGEHTSCQSIKNVLFQYFIVIFLDNLFFNFFWQFN